VVILNKGKLAAQGEMEKLKQIDYKLYEIRVKGESDGFIKKLRDKKSRIEETKDGILKVYLPPDKNPKDIFAIAAEENIQIRNFVKSRTTLEDLFAKAVGVD